MLCINVRRSLDRNEAADVDWIHRVKLEKLSTLLRHILLQTISCLGDDRWEVRRMSQQVGYFDAWLWCFRVIFRNTIIHFFRTLYWSQNILSQPPPPCSSPHPHNHVPLIIQSIIIIHWWIVILIHHYRTAII